jgi:hypothetical protein
MTPEQRAVFNFQVEEGVWLILDGGRAAVARQKARRPRFVDRLSAAWKRAVTPRRDI